MRWLALILWLAVAAPVQAVEWPVRVVYNGRAIGSEATFTRDAVSAGEDGMPVAADVRRFCSAPRSLCGFVDWQFTPINMGGGGTVLGGGPGPAGQPRLITRGPTFVVYAVNNTTGALTQLSSTAYTALPGASEDIAYTPRSCWSWYGLIVMMAQRADEGVSVGVTLFYSIDDGANWSRVENSAADGGGFDVPAPHGGAADGIDRGQAWAGPKPWPVGGIDAAGNFDADDVWWAWVDYSQGSGDTPKGYQSGVFRATKTGGVWTVSTNRILGERWEPAVSLANWHGHSTAVMDDGTGDNVGFVTIYGDTSVNDGMDFYAVDRDDFETAPITQTLHWHGGQDFTGATFARRSAQPASVCPGPDHSVLATTDETYEPVMRIEYAESAETTPVIKPLIYSVGDDISGNSYAGWTSLSINWFPGTGYIGGGGDVTYPTGDPARHFSPDGRVWGWLNDAGEIKGQAVLAGDWMFAEDAASDFIKVARVPAMRTTKPVRLSRGLDNKLGEDAPATLQAPQTGNTTRVAYWDEPSRTLRYVSDDEPVANSPSFPAPGVEGVYLILTTGPTDERHGAVYLQDSGDTIDITGTITAPLWIASLTPQTSPQFCGFFGISTASGDKSPSRSWQPGTTYGWMAAPNFENPANDTTGRGMIQMFAGRGAVFQPNRGNTAVYVSGLHEGDFAPYPTANSSTGNPDEKETIPLPGDSLSWTAAVTVFRPTHSQTTEITGETEKYTAMGGHLYTFYADANNYVAVEWDTAPAVIVTSVAGGVEVASISLPTTCWPRESPLTVALSSDGTKLEASLLCSIEGVVTGSDANGAPTTAPTELRFFDAAGGNVYGLDVAGVGYKGVYRTLSEIAAGELTELDFLAPPKRVLLVN